MKGLIRNKEYFTKQFATAEKVQKEVKDGLEILNSVQKPIITFFGSHTITEEEKYYQIAFNLAKELGKNGFAVCTGGGPGIMYAGNKGAAESGAESIGFKEALLQGEQGVGDEVFTHQYAFEFMFVRRFALAIKSEALVVFPGGFGTLNELFEYVCLMQTNIGDIVPIVLIGKEFWEGILDWSKEKIIDQYKFAKPEHMELFNVADSVEEALKIIQKEKEK